MTVFFGKIGHFAPDHFSDFSASKTYVRVGMVRYERVFIKIGKIAGQLEITAIRCK